MPDEILAPQGFRFAAAEAGIRKGGGCDVALIVSNTLAATAAAFTTNRVQAAPLEVSRVHLRRSRHRARAIVANAGNANCATPNGIDAARATAAAAARLLGARPEHILLASTGVIGVPLDAAKLTGALPLAVASLSPAAFAEAAAAILTTDTRPKIAGRRCGKARILGFAKGAGMIHPRMAHATMLAFFMTDAAISPRPLRGITTPAVGRTFNRISVDGDTSTNDTVFVLANGAAGPVAPSRLAQAFEEVMQELAVAVAADGEGARKRVRIQVAGARGEREAEVVARAVANSPLVKTALAGGDPNWGRILSAAGASGARIDPGCVGVTLQGVPVCRQGVAAEFDEGALARALSADSEIHVHLDLHCGDGRATFWTCDLTEDYIRINASYRT